jgi:hypothetical protein
VGAQEDLDKLLNALLPFAQQMLGQHGEFFPFGATMRPDGEMRMAAADAGEARPAPEEVLAAVENSLRADATAGTITAAGTAANVTVDLGEGPSDAIVVDLDHADGESVRVFLPYSEGESGGYVYGELVGGQGDRRFFSG